MGDIMSDIDWSKAPEWANYVCYYAHDSKSELKFVSEIKKGSRGLWFGASAEHEIHDPDSLIIVEKRQRNELSGEGLAPAFPVTDEDSFHGQHYGLTKREYFAIMIMQSVVTMRVDGASRSSVFLADQLLDELGK